MFTGEEPDRLLRSNPPYFSCRFATDHWAIPSTARSASIIKHIPWYACNGEYIYVGRRFFSLPYYHQMIRRTGMISTNAAWEPRSLTEVPLETLWQEWISNETTKR